MYTKMKLNSEQAAKEPINSNTVDFWHELNGETSAAVAANFPEDVVYEWPEPKQIRNFYFVRFWLYEDTMLKAKLEEADEDIYWKNQFRFQIIEELKEKRTERAKVISQLKTITKEDKKYRAVIADKRKEMEPLLAALGKLQNTNITARENGIGLCSSEEHNNLIHSLNYRVEHESHPLAAEKQFLEEIKQLEGTRDKVIANTKLKVEIQELLPQKEALEDQVKIISGDMDVVRKDQQAVWMKIKHLEEELKSKTDEIAFMEEQLDIVSNKRVEAYKTYNDLRKSWDDVNTLFYQNRSLLNMASDLAAEKNIAALEKHSISEVEKFMSLYSSSKAFRDDYERQILSSLDSRQLSRDGRMRNPDEELIIEQQPLNEPETTPVKITAKQAEVTLASPQQDILLTHKVQDEIPKPTEDKILTPIKVEPKRKPGRTENIDDTDEIGESKELPKPNDINAAKLKEMKREEEMAKAKLAMERKQKLTEKAAAKKASRAQKEAEKKIKPEEKQARKKAEMCEMDTKSEEPEEAEWKVEAPVPADTKEKREKVRYRGRTKVPAPIPKAILKRKRSPSYWLWVATSGVILALIFLAYIAIN